MKQKDTNRNQGWSHEGDGAAGGSWHDFWGTLRGHPGSISGVDREPLALTWGEGGSPFSSASPSRALMNLGSQTCFASTIPPGLPAQFLLCPAGSTGLAGLEAGTLSLDSCCHFGFYPSVWHLLDDEYVLKE